MKKTLFFVICFFACANLTFSQLKVSANGSVSINAQIEDWWSGLKVSVPTQQSCAFNLSYLQKDRFFVTAEGWIWAEKGSWFGSDINLKQNINPINSPLSIILALKGVQFDYKGTTSSKDSESLKKNQRIGFIAQDVEKVLPGIVKTMPDETKAVSYTDVIPVTVEAIKEQQKQIEDLKKITIEQQRQIEELIKNVNSKKKRRK